MLKFEFHVQEAEVTGPAYSYSVERLSQWAPFITIDEERSVQGGDSDPSSVEWWVKKWHQANGTEYVQRKERKHSSFGHGPTLEQLLELYYSYGWEHYTTTLTTKEDPESVSEPDFATITLLLFFRKACE